MIERESPALGMWITRLIFSIFVGYMHKYKIRKKEIDFYILFFDAAFLLNELKIISNYDMIKVRRCRL